jgi:hypothetical protein
MTRVAGIALASLVLVPAAAGTSTARPSVALTASPARVMLVGAGRATVQLSNRGSRAVVVEVGRAGFALDLRGRPRIVSKGFARAADAWLTVRPRRVVVPSRGNASLTVTAKLPRRVEPGDHDALVVLTTRPQLAGGVAVRMRVGVRVVVRAPGGIVRRLDLRELRVRRAGRSRVLELLVVNRGNITETLFRSRVELTLRQSGRGQSRVRPATRELRPGTRGIVQFVYRGRLRGAVTAGVAVALERGPVSRRSYRLRL